MKRRTLFPIPMNEQWAYDLYDKAVKSFWIPGELTYHDDRLHFPELDKDTQRFIKYVLAFFASSDSLVNDNLALRFYSEFESPSIQAFYSIQIGIEQIHSQTYSEQIEALISSAPEKEEIFNAIETFPVITKMSKYIASICNSTSTISHRLVMMLGVEGIMFSSSFCAIYWLKKSGKMPGLAAANELISRDEGMHAEFAACLYKYGYVPKLSDNEVYKIIKGVVDLTKEFALEALPVSLIGMSSKSMGEYIEFVADFWLIKLGLNPYYRTPNPFSWMLLISLENKTNFFEKRVTEYSKAVSSAVVNLLEDF